MLKEDTIATIFLAMKVKLDICFDGEELMELAKINSLTLH